MSMVVIRSPLKLGNHPVRAVPAPNMTSDNIAKRCSAITISRKTTPNAKKPGTSRQDCNTPMWAPFKPPCSMAKLLNKAIHTPKLKGIAKVIS